MKTFKDYLMEVQEPLSQGEKNFYAMHKPETKSYVPGVTDQDHIFKGNERRKDPKTASYEIEKSEDQSVAAYDKNLKVHDNPSVQKEDAALAALAPPKDEVTKKDVLVGRGVLKKDASGKHVVAKEEVEQIEEAKPKSYLDTMKKASKDSANRAPGSTPSWLTKSMANRKPDDVKFSYDMPDGRTGLGVHKAGEKIDKKKYPGYSVAKEEVEQIEELKKSTLKNYVSKATDSYDDAEGNIHKSDMAHGVDNEDPNDVKTLVKRNKGIKMAIKKLAKEETNLSEAGMPKGVIKHKQDLADLSDKEFAEKHGNKTEKELRDMAARHGYGWNRQTKTGSDHYLRRVERGKKANEEVEQVNELSGDFLAHASDAADKKGKSNQSARLGAAAYKKGISLDFMKNKSRFTQSSRDKSATLTREESELEEKKLTSAEIEKRNEVADAIKRKNPNMPTSDKMAIATATAKKVAEAVLSAKQKKIASLKEPKDEIDAGDLAALRRGEHKK